jgi:2,3-bisphosphoglycerate-dependent phosphoglycerate mutase
MIARQFGEVQFKLWRRGYKVKPPALNSFAPEYPGNDKRYQKYLKDLRYSVSETFIRSIGNQRWTPSRKFPKTESLFLCMKRTIPYLTEVILPKAVNENKRVLIASSENAIRGMLMKLCDIPEEMISELSIPNGVPMIYDVKSRCLKLLDDGRPVSISRARTRRSCGRTLQPRGAIG